MMRALYAGVSGLRTHQTKMDVIGNNIANVNTTSYKSQNVTFRDLMYQTTQKASGPNPNTGLAGVNARQIGLGSTTGAINTNITSQGSTQTTNNPWDVMINGDAFFVVSNGQENFFTRDGSFYVDGQGNLAMTSNGYNVMGWQVDDTTGQPKSDTVSALRIMNDTNQTYPAEATTEARVTGIIDKFDTKVNSTSGRIANFNFYDKAGFKYTAKLSFHSTTTKDNFYVKLDDIVDASGKSLGQDVLNNVTFGQAGLSVDVSKGYTPANATVTGTGSFTLTNDGKTFTGAIGTTAINTPTNPDELAALQATYKDADFTKIESFTIDGSGKLTVVTAAANAADLVGEEYSAKKGNFAPSKVEVKSGAFTEEYDVGQVVDATAMVQADKDMIKNLYGLDIDAQGVEEFSVGADGTLTVTKQTVKNAANIVFSTAESGRLISVNGNGEGTMTLGFGGAVDFLDINVDFSSCSSVNNKGSSTVSAVPGDSDGLGAGRMEGKLQTIGIDQSGIIKATYDNGMSRILGQLAVAQFANASGLEKLGDNLYASTANSGDFDGTGKDITATGGKMNSGVLEMSNVDLSAEFTEMITTQRGFQANSRIITVSDTMLEELTNLKR